MKKKILLLLVIGCPAVAVRSQSIADVSEQLAIDVQKLASIRSTLKELISGYEQVKAGYTNIRKIVRDNLQLHKSFLDALWVLSPAVRNDPRLTSILGAATRLVKTYQSATTQFGNNPVFTAGELRYITGTLSALLQRCTAAIEELKMVTTDNQLRMSDAQRLAALDRLDAGIRNDAAFLQSFTNSLAVEVVRRQREANDITTLKALYGLPD